MPLNAASASLALAIPANALVRELTVKVQADSASWMPLGALGQVRVQDSSISNSTRTTVVLDFGMPRTVASLKVVPANAAYKLRAVWRWQGDSFDLQRPVWTATDATGVASLPFAEVSTERLQMEFFGTVTQADAENNVSAQLPALPADLELRINGGQAVWTYPGPVRTGLDGWATVGAGDAARTQKEVPLTEPVAALLGNPDNQATVTLNLELRARVPGRLALLPGTQSWDILQRIPLQPDGNLTFDAEGAQELPLGPAGKTLKEVRVRVAGSLPRERAAPAVGPAVVPQVELVLDSGRSACVRFPEGLLAELTALRLPLRAQGGEAEVRAQLLSPVPVDAGDEPGAPLEGQSATRPVTLDPPASDDTSEGWTLLPFEKPVAVKGAVWVSLRVTRGTVRWSLGGSRVAADAFPVRRGAPTGPWVPLPPAVATVKAGRSGELTLTVGGRLHAIGHAPKEHPLAPLQLQVASSGETGPEVVDVNPTGKGVAVTLLVNDPVQAQSARLRVTSRSAGMVTVQDLVTVVSR